MNNPGFFGQYIKISEIQVDWLTTLNCQLKIKIFLEIPIFRPIIDNSSFSADNLRFSTNIPAYTDNVGLSLIIQVF